MLASYTKRGPSSSQVIGLGCYRFITAFDELVRELLADGRPSDVSHTLCDHRVVLHLAQAPIVGVAQTFGTLKNIH